jgi:osmotically-inducible protein OsmY
MKTDIQLQQDVLAELKWEPSVNAAHIGVEVNDGIVTLAGHVGSYAEKWGAEHAAQRVSGVKALAVEMEVNLLGLGKRSDADIGHAVENVLEWLTVLPKDSVKAVVESGWVTLSGKVDWHFQRDAATGAVRNLMGVTGVSNDIAIAPTLHLNIIKSDIEAALKRHARADAQNIAIDIVGTDVTLTGTVPTWAEHDLVVHSAWSSAGVRNVNDKIMVTN